MLIKRICSKYSVFSFYKKKLAWLFATKMKSSLDTGGYHAMQVGTAFCSSLWLLSNFRSSSLLFFKSYSTWVNKCGYEPLRWITQASTAMLLHRTYKPKNIQATKTNIALHKYLNEKYKLRNVFISDSVQKKQDTHWYKQLQEVKRVIYIVSMQN